MDVKEIMQPAMDLQRIFSAQESKRRWRAERENASAHVELATVDEGCAALLSSHEPVASLGIDRKVLRVLLHYVRHGDIARRDRDLSELCGQSDEAASA